MSGNIILTSVSGDIVQISGQAVTVSGDIVQISGQCVVTDSGSVTTISGNIVQVGNVSDQALNVSILSGTIVTLITAQLEKYDQILVELRKINSHLALINDKVITEEDIILDMEDNNE